MRPHRTGLFVLPADVLRLILNRDGVSVADWARVAATCRAGRAILVDFERDDPAPHEIIAQQLRFLGVPTRSHRWKISNGACGEVDEEDFEYIARHRFRHILDWLLRGPDRRLFRWFDATRAYSLMLAMARHAWLDPDGGLERCVDRFLCPRWVSAMFYNPQWTWRDELAPSQDAWKRQHDATFHYTSMPFLVMLYDLACGGGPIESIRCILGREDHTYPLQPARWTHRAAGYRIVTIASISFRHVALGAETFHEWMKPEVCMNQHPPPVETLLALVAAGYLRARDQPCPLLDVLWESRTVALALNRLNGCSEYMSLGDLTSAPTWITYRHCPQRHQSRARMVREMLTRMHRHPPSGPLSLSRLYGSRGRGWMRPILVEYVHRMARVMGFREEADALARIVIDEHGRRDLGCWCCQRRRRGRRTPQCLESLCSHVESRYGRSDPDPPWASRIERAIADIERVLRTVPPNLRRPSIVGRGRQFFPADIEPVHVDREEE